MSAIWHAKGSRPLGSASILHPSGGLWGGAPSAVPFPIIAALVQGVLRAVAAERKRLATAKPKFEARPTVVHRASSTPCGAQKYSHARENQ